MLAHISVIHRKQPKKLREKQSKTLRSRVQKEVRHFRSQVQNFHLALEGVRFLGTPISLIHIYISFSGHDQNFLNLDSLEQLGLTPSRI